MARVYYSDFSMGCNTGNNVMVAVRAGCNSIQCPVRAALGYFYLVQRSLHLLADPTGP